MATPRIEALERKHRPLLKAFSNQKPSLVEYLHRYALRHGEKDLLARTYLAIDKDEDVARIAGYFSLSTVSVERSSVDDIPTLSKLPRFPIPGVLLARLAVDQRVQGQGLGRFLFEEALGLTLQLATVGPVAFRLFVTDAVDDQAARFYERFGLHRLSDTYPVRMVLDIQPLIRAVSPASA
ncbi:MAG: GNAT family N-acetyltransferase [Deltaproteobacteria bacterium]|nr:GNAT family N-acetyltransferase [Deltaproteobacteria bacterium]